MMSLYNHKIGRCNYPNEWQSWNWHPGVPELERVVDAVIDATMGKMNYQNAEGNHHNKKTHGFQI